MIRPRRAPLLALVLLAATFLPAAPETGSLITAKDLLRVKQLQSPALSPAGNQAVYTVKSIEEKNGRPGLYTYRSQLWLLPLEGGGAARALTAADENAAFPDWHPKGDRIAYVRTENNVPQIWILSVAGGRPFRVTQMPGGATHPRWSPDGTRLLFQATRTLSEVREEISAGGTAAASHSRWPDERPGRPREKSKNPDLAAADRWLAQREQEGNPRVLTRLEFLGDDDLSPVETFTHLYLCAAEKNAAPQLLTPGYLSADGAEWADTPAGLRVIFSAESPGAVHPDRVLERALWTVPLDGSAPRLLLHTPNFSYTRPTASPDGRTIAYIAEDLSLSSYAQNQLGVIPAEGGAPKLLTTRFDRSVTRPRWSADGGFLYFTAPTNGGHPLFRVAAHGNAEPERLTAIANGIRSYDLNARHCLVVLTKPENPYELYQLDLSNRLFRVLTSHNSGWLRTKTVVTPQRLQFDAEEGIKVDAWLMKPSFFEPGKKYPLLVAIHGGPHAMWGPGDSAMWHEFQFFAARGYGILYCNPRGSGGYGTYFQKQSFQNWGPGPASDVLAATDLAGREPWVDKDRLVLSGGSYGGYLTAWIVSHDRRFKAAIAQRGIYDLATVFGEGSAWRLVPYHFGGYPWQPSIRRLLDAQSPLSHAENIFTPLLIKQGDEDRRVGTGQSEMLFRALKVLNRPVEYVRYPQATHEMSRTGDPAQRIDRLLRFDEFFRRFIGE